MAKQRIGETREDYLIRIREYYRKARKTPEFRAKNNVVQNVYYHAHFEAISARRKELHQLHYQDDLAKKRVWGLSWRQRIRFEALQAYSDKTPKCACCGETILEFLTIDHINGGGNKHIDPKYGGNKRLGGVGLYRWLADHNFPPGYQVLCYNCNAAKGHYGICPHQKP